MKRYLIYFFGTDFDRVKIGICKTNLYARHLQIKVGCPNPIKLLGIIRCKDKAEMSIKEKKLHKQFQEYRTVGEWFRIVPEISAYIDKFTESGEDIMQEDSQRYREKHCENSRRRSKANPEGERDRKREWYQNNREEILEKKHEYHKSPKFANTVVNTIANGIRIILNIVNALVNIENAPKFVSEGENTNANTTRETVSGSPVSEQKPSLSGID